MWNQSPSASFGALLQHIAQSNPQVFQAIMQMAAQRQQGTGGIGSLPPAQGGPMPQGGMWGQTGQRPTNPLPYAQRFNASPMPAASAQMPTTSNNIANQTPYTPPAYSSPMPGWDQPSGPKFYPPSGPKQYRPTQPSYTPLTGPKQWGTPEPYAAPTGPKYMPPTGPKVFGQTTPAEPPAFTPPQPKQWGAPAMPMAGDGTSGLDWYAQQAGN